MRRVGQVRAGLPARRPRRLLALHPSRRRSVTDPVEEAAERLADNLRDWVAALEILKLGPAEVRLLANLRSTLAEWETDR